MRLQLILWPFVAAGWAWVSYAGLDALDWASLVIVICGLIIGVGNFIEWLILRDKR